MQSSAPSPSKASLSSLLLSPPTTHSSTKKGRPKATRSRDRIGKALVEPARSREMFPRPDGCPQGSVDLFPLPTDGVLKVMG